MHEVDDDPEAIHEFLCEKGLSDGLPVIPPTAERVERMLAYCDRDLDKPVVRIPPRFGAATRKIKNRKNYGPRRRKLWRGYRRRGIGGMS